jgi:hypothetical protein
MLSRNDIIFGVIAPALVSTVIVLLAWLATRDRGWAVPVAVGVGFFVGFYLLFRPGFPPGDSVQWLAWAAPIAAAAGVVQWGMTRGTSRLGTVWFVNLTIVAALAGVIVWLMLRPLFGSTWDEAKSTGVMWIAAIAAATAVWWIQTDVQAARDSGPTFAVALVIVLALASATMAMTGSQTLGQIGGMLAAAVGAVALIGLFLSGMTLARGGIVPIAVLFVPLLAASLDGFFSTMPRHYAAGLLLSPLGGWLAELPVVKRRSPIVRGTVRILASVALAAIVTVFAFLAFRRDMVESGELGWQ